MSKKVRTIAAIVLAVILMLSQSISVFAVSVEDFVVNDVDFDPVTGSVSYLAWDEHFRSGIDSAFTQARSNAFSDGSADHIVFIGNEVRFFGYYTGNILDYLDYDAPAPTSIDNVDDEFSFSIQPDGRNLAASMYHSLLSYGFLINCTKNSDGTVSGYCFSFDQTRFAIKKIDHVNLEALSKVSTSTSGTGSYVLHNCPVVWSMPATNDVASGAVGTKSDFVLKSTYTGFTVIRNGVELVTIDIATTAAVNVPSGYTGGNDFGLYAAYNGVGHTCSSLSAAVMSNIGIYTEMTAAKVNLGIDIIEVDEPSIEEEPVLFAAFAAVEEGPVALTFTMEGYVGQGYTITPPEKIDKLSYIGDEETISGRYGLDGASETLDYVNARYIVNAYDEKSGELIATTTYDGLDIGKIYTVNAEELSGYQIVGSSTTSFALTKDDWVKTVDFTYKFSPTAGNSNSPTTGDANGVMLWIAIAGASLLVIIVGAATTKKTKKTYKLK